jgi:hypothetical protein
MQAIIAMADVTPEQLMQLNDSVNKLVNSVMRLEMMLQTKLELFADESGGSQTTPPAATPTTTASAELQKIIVPTVAIAVPLDDPTAQQAAVAAAVAAAQAQVDAGYTVTFTPTAYTPGVLTGKFTVTNASDATDTAADTADRTIAVTSAAAPPVTATAAAQLQSVNVPSVTIAVPLTDPAAQQAAVTQAVTQAQAQVAPDYTVSLSPTNYSPTAPSSAAASLVAVFAAEVNPSGLLTGKFTVTNNADSNDTAVDMSDRSIIVYSSAAPVTTATAASNAAAQFLSGTLLGAGVPAALAGVTAHYDNSAPTATLNDTEYAGLGAGDITQPTVSFGATPVPLSDLLQLNMVNQYAQASADGVSLAFAGAVSDSGAVDTSGTGQFSSSVSLNLMNVIPQTDALSTAELTLGAITGAAQYDVKQGNTLATNADVTNPVQGRGYSIGSAALNLVSPAFSEMTGTINNAASALSTAFNGLGSSVVDGVVNGIANNIDQLSGLLPGVSVGANTLTATVSLDLTAPLAPVLSDPIVSTDGALTVNVGAGTLGYDFDKQLNGTLNNLAPNTALIDLTVVQTITGDFNDAVSTMQNTLNDVINGVLDIAAVDLKGHITMLELLGQETAGMDVSYNGTLGDLLSGASAINLSGSGSLGSLISMVAGGLNNAIVGLISSVVTPLLNTPGTGFLSIASTAFTGAVNTMTGLFSPALALFGDAMTVIINVQQNDVDGAGTFTEIPVQLNLLSGGMTFNLGKVVVGPNIYTA